MPKTALLLSNVIDGLHHRPARKNHRFNILYLFLIFIVSVLAIRSFQLQIIRGSNFLLKAEGNRVSLLPLPAPRGLIYDRNHDQLVENIASTDVVFDPTFLPDRDNESTLLELLPDLLHTAPADIQKALNQARSQQRLTVITKAVPHEVVLELEEQMPHLPGVRLISSSVRKYLHGLAAAHVLGYTSAVTADELSQKKELLSTDQTGKDGLEKIYDSQLRGAPGALYNEINANGRPVATLGQKDATPGQDINLTLNVSLQEFIYDTLKQHYADKHTEQGAAVIVMEPSTGAIHALVSYPSYDPNAFSQPEQHGALTQFFNNPLQPLFNRTINGLYPPGSTIKPLLAAAALQEGIINEQTTVLSTGGLTIGPWHFPDWKKGGHGVTDLNKAIAESVNTFFYLLSGGDETHHGLGIEKMAYYLKAFNWDNQTGIDLPGEASGFIPSPQWKQKVKKESWYIGDTYHLGIGQGDILATPLQVTLATATIANGGVIHQPYLVQNTKHKSRTLPISASNLDLVRQAMRTTVTDGSGRALGILPLAIAGKTGTAQIGGTEDTHAWFTSFGPFEQPRFVVTVLLERDGGGDEVAVPIAKQIWTWLIEHKEM